MKASEILHELVLWIEQERANEQAALDACLKYMEIERIETRLEMLDKVEQFLNEKTGLRRG